MNASMKFRSAVLAVIVVIAGMVGIAACADDEPTTYQPVAYPMVGGVTYCPALYGAAEVMDCHGTPYVIPAAWVSVRPSASDLVAMAVWDHYLTYGPSYYHTDYYYRRNIVQHAHITTVTINNFHSSASTFDSKWAADEKRFTPKFKDSKGHVVTGSKYGQLNNKVVTKLPVNGGNKPAGGVKDPAMVTNGKPTAPPTKPPVVNRPTTSGRG